MYHIFKIEPTKGIPNWNLVAIFFSYEEAKLFTKYLNEQQSEFKYKLTGNGWGYFNPLSYIPPYVDKPGF